MLRLNRMVVSLVLAVVLMASFSAPAFAAAGNNAEFIIGMNRYFVNDQTPPGISMDAAPYIDSASGRTLVPVRYLANALGVTDSNIQWNPVTQQVSLVQGSTTIVLTIGSTTMTVNGKAQTLDVAPVIKDGRTYLPARWVANALGYQVDWNAQYKIVIIWPNGTTEPDISNVIGQTPTSSTVLNGFNVPAGTLLGIGTTGTSANVPMSFVIDTTKGDTQGQLADAQNILSQSKLLDPATVSTAMAAINYDLTSKTTLKRGGINSPNGGSVVISPGMGNWVDVEIWTMPQPASMLITN